jgi:hypothetical protein
MNEERREMDRYPTFTDVELISTDSSGNQTTYSIMLRDASERGIGGVYIGPKSLSIDDSYQLKNAGDELRDVRLAWLKKVAKYVYLVGIEVL